MKQAKLLFLFAFTIAMANVQFAIAEEANTIKVTEENFTHAETARNFRNWASKGATKQFVKMPGLPPRGKEAPTVQMNDDTLYGVAIVKAVEGKITFSIPETDNYMAVQVVTERGHGQHYVVEDGKYELPIESDYAMLIYRSGTENGIDFSKEMLEKVDPSDLNFATDYKIQPYDYEEVETWVKKYTAEVNSMDNFTYTFPRTSDLVTDLHQWNLENAAGWGGASPEAFVGNKYANSPIMKASTCYTSTFEDPKNKFFTSITAYDSDKYLMDGVRHISSNTWDKNADGTITISFNCGEDAKNNIDTKGNDFTFTSRHYGVNPKVMEAKKDPIISAVKAN
ncbi:hypothetical protein A3742_11205 [Oleiphilus sp. HI0071]|uniref:DUF1214 domain-containing protein n=1 Tax=Oleiphilus sp. HI0080 TaxID=1822255 RepID=UPI0007C21549|nr:DUF1214 domain-containing protein [Oleiphilus sp. HI0080]KZY62219.1 hypothetical protein A3737_04320 [Oleiphilus sp. HI0065]KZY81701.1 hypothetical protein A3742_11205 [Oleiphilus sp. HI0071]KZZ00843.1 hypothetical protein A3744_11935 [Oleiphilus sp. HI0073]KZZ48226.1 hypothetical protein A3760_04150 [Oleiphilus sp. HI0122]KZZ79295.1 hypothetical protein A3767_11350 [Oleiphilus sp. HI0133]